jgi:hypothetical protein
MTAMRIGRPCSHELCRGATTRATADQALTFTRLGAAGQAAVLRLAWSAGVHASLAGRKDHLPTPATFMPPALRVLVVDFDLLLADVLSHPFLASLPLGGADAQLFFGAGHGVVSRPPGQVSPHSATAGCDVIAGGMTIGGVVVEAVVAPQLPPLSLRQVPVQLHPWSVLDSRLS